MTIPEKQELVRLLNLYQADLLDQNWENCENGITKDFVPGVKAHTNTPELSARNSLSNSASVSRHGERNNYKGEIDE